MKEYLNKLVVFFKMILEKSKVFFKNQYAQFLASKIGIRFMKMNRFKKSIAIICALCIAGFAFICLLFLLVRFEIITNLPSRKELKEINNPLTTELYSREKKIFGYFFDENRGELKAEDLTPEYKNALIATEDIRFYEHSGIDYRALGRVFVKSLILQNDNSGGGSTLTQQLSKNLFPRKNYWFLSLIINKFREICIAKRLESVYTKDEILLLYSNTVSFGERAFGLSTASSRFFGKTPDKLNLSEAATLVGILKATTYYSPRKNPERAQSRRNTVLKQMHKYEFLDSLTMQKAIDTELKVNYKPLSETIGFGRYFQQIVRKEFEAWAEENLKEDGTKYNISRDGLKIYTTLDYNLQIAAERALKRHMVSLQKSFDNSWKNGKLFGEDDKHLKLAFELDPYYKELKKSGKSDDEIREIFNKVDKKSFWTFDGMVEKEASKMDSLKYNLSLLHAGVLGVNPENGQITVYIGGNDFGQFQWDNVQSPRQVGSTFKPFVYLSALESGVQPCDYFANELRTYSQYENWAPQNSDGRYGGYLSLKEALTRSVNTISVQMIFKAGIKNIVKKARDLGITANLPAVPSLVLGTADISLFEMVKAYSGIANGGIAPDLHTILKIETQDGQVLFERKKVTISHELPIAYAQLNAILANVVNEGTAARLRSYDIPFQIMGKTGTTQNQTDGWFIGYTNNLVLGSWVGAQNKGIHFRSLSTGAGGRSALPLVGAVFENAGARGYKPEPLPIVLLPSCPDSISQEEFDYLKEFPGDYQHIINERSGGMLDSLFEVSEVDDGQDLEDAEDGDENRVKQDRMSDFEKFKEKVEEDLKNIFKSKKNKESDNQQEKQRDN